MFQLWSDIKEYFRKNQKISFEIPKYLVVTIRFMYCLCEDVEIWCEEHKVEVLNVRQKSFLEPSPTGEHIVVGRGGGFYVSNKETKIKYFITIRDPIKAIYFKMRWF